MTSDLAEAEVVDSSDNFSQAAHRLCVSEPGSDVAPRHSRAGTISFRGCVSRWNIDVSTDRETAQGGVECSGRDKLRVWAVRVSAPGARPQGA